MNDFKDTSLDDITKFGGMEPMGAGSYGGTIWQATTLVNGEWRTTFLHNIGQFGGMEPMGAGSYGGTIWDKVI